MEEAKLKKKFDELSEMKDIVFSSKYRNDLTINEALLISAVLVLSAEIEEFKEVLIQKHF